MSTHTSSLTISQTSNTPIDAQTIQPSPAMDLPHRLERDSLKQRVEYLSGCIKRLGNFASPKLIAMQREDEKLLSDGQQEVYDAPNRSWLENLELEQEITTCAQNLAQKIPFSPHAIQQVSIGSDPTQAIKRFILPLVTIAVRKGHASKRNFSLGDRSSNKVSCHFEEDLFPKVEIRRLFNRGPSKRLFRIIHLNEESIDCVEAYAKIDKNLRSSSPTEYERLQRRLQRDGDVSWFLHTSKDTEHSAGHENAIEHLLKIRKVYHRKNPTLFKGLVMEYCDMYDISNVRLSSAGECKKRTILAYQIARALQAMHEQHICHMDIKPENTFLRSERGDTSVRLGDFEFATAQGTVMGQRIGTLIFLPPEVLTADQWIALPSIDMWSFGLTLLEMAHGRKANQFPSRVSSEFFSKSHQFMKETWETIHSDIIAHLNKADPLDQLIVDLLNFHTPSERPSSKETASRLLALLSTLQ